VVYFVENNFGLPYFLDASGRGALKEATRFVAGMFQNASSEKSKLHSELVKISDANRALIRLDRWLGKNKITGLLFFNPGGGHHEETLKKLWARSSLEHLAFVDLLDDFLKVVEQAHYMPSQLTLETDPHPSALKHELLAQLMAPLLIERMKER
jgi:hypothetical protein